MSIDIDMESSESDYDPGEESGQPLGHAGSLHLTVRADLDDLVGTLLNLRALRAFRGGPQRYPIHRVVRCAARGCLEELFDELALKSGFAAQRIDAGSLLLDGSGVFVILRGRRNSQYISCTFTMWADTPDHACGVEKGLLDIIGEKRLREEMFTMDWRFMGGYGGLLRGARRPGAVGRGVSDARRILGAVHRELSRCARDRPDPARSSGNPEDPSRTGHTRRNLPAKGRERESALYRRPASARERQALHAVHYRRARCVRGRRCRPHSCVACQRQPRRTSVFGDSRRRRARSGT